MRLLTVTALFALASVPQMHAQSLLAKPGVQHATVASAQSVASAASGAAVTLWADVTPNPSIHIYAEGAKDFTPVSLLLTPNAAIAPGKPTYPKPGSAAAPGATDAVPAYAQTFRIGVPVTIRSTAKPGEVLTVAGTVNYQACDDRLCYPVTAAPVVWTISVK